MTDDEARDLGERLVACKGFRWMPGMLVHSGAWPDLRDAATRGCVLQLLCDMYGDPNITLAYDLKTLYPKTRIWAVIRQEDNRDLAVLSEHACREEALALALEGT